MLVDEQGVRYVTGTDVIRGVEVPCKMPIVRTCSKCGFEWPDVLNRGEVIKLEDGKGCPECREENR